MRNTLLCLLLTALACNGAKTPPETAPEPAAPAPEPAAPVPAPGTAEGEPASGPTQIASSRGAIELHPVSHATFRLTVPAHEGAPARTIWVDPVGEAGSLEGKADLVLVTDIHGDHLDPAGIEAVRREGTVIVAPSAVAEQLAKDAPGLMGVTPVANGERATLPAELGVTVEAVPMYNLVRGPKPGQLFHDKGRGNGYVLTAGDTRIYISGDTECIDEMKALTDIDVAFVCMNLPYTMTPEEAATCVTAFEPAVVYPYHYNESDLELFAGPVSAAGVEVRRLDWYPGK
jgi:L-ascorbate metabolism protein UlaG (beta-lactamase superfamily)